MAMLAMGAALGSMGNDSLNSSFRTTKEDAKDIQEWARDKVAKEREEKEKRERNNQFRTKYKKPKKHVFNVTYGKGVKPVFS